MGRVEVTQDGAKFNAWLDGKPLRNKHGACRRFQTSEAARKAGEKMACLIVEYQP